MMQTLLVGFMSIYNYFFVIVGKQPKVLTPLQNLRVEEIRQELGARGDYDLDKHKPELQLDLWQILKGVNCVPSLLLINPQQNIQDLHLTEYTILNCEPLHDVKGHLANLMEELPNLLQGSQKEKCNDLLVARLGGKVSGADMHSTVITLYVLLLKEGTKQCILDLLHSIIKISQILYSDEQNGSPKQVLSLYNNAWLHMELCKELLPNPHAITRRKLYGIYLHALTTHAPLQYEIVSQKSINAENQERLFGQARRTAEATSNRHPENIIFSILLRLQAKKEAGHMLYSINEVDSQVSRAAKNLTQFNGSTFSKKFVKKVVGLTLLLTRPSQLCQVERKVLGITLAHTPLSASSSRTEGSGINSLAHMPLSVLSSRTEDSGINSLTHTPPSASSNRTEGSGVNSLTHTPPLSFVKSNGR